MAPQSISEVTAKTRSYRSELRQRQADSTREKVIAAAADLFAVHGYARTTLPKIAKAAGVSTETVQGHGPKAALLITAIQYAAFGIMSEENIFNLEVGRRALEIVDREEAIEYFVTAQTDVHQRSAGLLQTLAGAAAGDAELARHLKEVTASINREIGRVLEMYRDRGWLRDDVGFDEVVETVLVLASVESFLRFTERDGWSATAYQAWLRRMLAETVFRTAR